MKIIGQFFIANFVTLPDGMYICVCVCQDEVKQNDRYTHVTACQPISFPLGCPFYSCMNHAIVQDGDRYIPGEQNAMCNVSFNHKVTIYVSLLDMMLV